jgi:hypothetical protein
MKNKSLHLLIGLLPTIIGGFIYIIYRSDSLLMFKWFDYLGLESIINILRNSSIANIKLPDILIYSIPDALWIFSFTYIMLLLWDFKISKQSIIWILIGPIIGIGSELLQYISIIPGTFDINDLILSTISAILPFSFLTFKKLNNYKL